MMIRSKGDKKGFPGRKEPASSARLVKLPHLKGVSTVLSVILLFVIVVIAVGMVLSIAQPVADSAVKQTEIKNAEDDLHFIDNYITTVAREGKDSARIYKFSSPKSFESIPGEDAIEFTTDADINVIDYLSRKMSGNFVYVSGDNVNCQEKDGDGDGTIDLVAENDKIRAVFRQVALDTAIVTDRLLLQITEKTRNITTYVGNSSIVINDDPSTSVGVGFSRLSRDGVNLPLCQVHAFVNSTVDYDVYYKLYAGADFLVVEVRNIV
ncbi:MAG: hypothetical protein HY517_00970 [Candidatus Aenigmarchaeota archaeon]|nr:hypothetical protein [Candidatus Aenigmarchaeota archaeon]